MKINRDNYESYLVDFAEGNLPECQIQEMEQFLAANPDIREELAVFQEAIPREPSIRYTRKQELKKIPYLQMEAHSELFQQKCVAYFEQLMPDSEIPLLLESVEENAAKKREFEFFKQTILHPGNEIYDEKLFLKQHPITHVINPNNFESYCVACMEGWLSQSGLAALNNYVKEHPEQKRILDLFYKTRLVPEVSVFYPNKHQLKRFTLLTTRTKKILTYASSAAAIFIFGAMLFYTSQVQKSSTIAATSMVTANQNGQMQQPVYPTKGSNVRNELEKKVQKKRFSDPFGYQKVHAANTSKSNRENQDSENLIPVTPIPIAEIDCDRCKEVFTSHKNLQLEPGKFDNGPMMVERQSEGNKALELDKNEWIKKVAQEGIKQFSKITNTELIIEKEEKNEKTKIAFNSKYFAFSTQLEPKKD